VLHSDDLLLLPLLLADLSLLDLLLALDLLLLFALDDSDALVELGEQVRELRVDLVDEVAEIGAGLVVDALEEHDRGEVLLEILHLISRHFSLQYINDILFLACHNLFCKFDDLRLQVHDAVNVPA